MVGVIGSLVFVGLEMRQSQRIALVNQIQQRSYTVQASISAFTEANKDWFSAQFPALPTKNLSEVEKDIRNVLNQAWFVYEADYFQYSQGLMTDEVWQAKLRGIVTNLKRCDNQEIYRQRIKLVEEDFQRILEGVPFDCE
jgi:hypothetical protein